MIHQNPRPVNRRKVNGAILIAVVVVLLLVILIAFSPYVMVPTGHTGVVVTMGRVSDEVLPEGLQFKLPWQNVIFIDNRTQKAQVVTQAFSSDIQQVDVVCSVNYSIDRETSQNLYRNVGTEYYNTVMLPRIMENLKGTFSKYSADNLVMARETLAQQILKLLVPELKPYGIEVLSVAIENIDFTDAFTDAVESKQVAEQTKLKTIIQQEELLSIEESSAKRLQITAEANSEVSRINADARAYALRTQAEAEAETNKLIAESITDQLIKYVEANNWNGVLPQFMAGGGDIMPILNMDSNVEAQ